VLSKEAGDTVKIDFMPSVYEHAAAIIKRTPWEVSRDPELMYLAHKEAHNLYGHTPITVGIDIYNLEAEAYGCQIQQPDGNGIPAITDNIFSSIEHACNIQPFNPVTAGRIPLVMEAGQALAREFPRAKVAIPVSGPFSIAVSLRGLEGLLTDLVIAPEQVRHFLSILVEGQVRFCQAIAGAGLDVVLFESAAAPPLLSPEQFRDIEFPELQKLLAGVAQKIGQRIPCVIGGNTTAILKYILMTGTSFVICPAEADRESFLRELGDRSDVRVRINLNPDIVVNGSRDQIIAAVDEVVRLAEGRENLLLGTGALPYETPPENVLLIKEYVQ